jgi:hypothetical protein
MPPIALEQSPALLALKRSPQPSLRRLALQETDDLVVINGNVGSYYLKQLAQETVMPMLAGRRLHNNVQVVRRPPLVNS